MIYLVDIPIRWEPEGVINAISRQCPINHQTWKIVQILNVLICIWLFTNSTIMYYTTDSPTSTMLELWVFIGTTHHSKSVVHQIATTRTENCEKNLHLSNDNKIMYLVMGQNTSFKIIFQLGYTMIYNVHETQWHVSKIKTFRNNINNSNIHTWK